MPQYGGILADQYRGRSPGEGVAPREANPNDFSGLWSVQHDLRQVVQFYSAREVGIKVRGT